MASLGRIIGKIANSAILGPLGYLAKDTIKSNNELKRQEASQTKEYEKQRDIIRREQDKINQSLEASRAKTAQGVARASRSRIRGGMFGDQSPGPGLNPRLG